MSLKRGHKNQDRYPKLISYKTCIWISTTIIGETWLKCLPSMLVFDSIVYSYSGSRAKTTRFTPGYISNNAIPFPTCVVLWHIQRKKTNILISTPVFSLKNVVTISMGVLLVFSFHRLWCALNVISGLSESTLCTCISKVLIICSCDMTCATKRRRAMKRRNVFR